MDCSILLIRLFVLCIKYCSVYREDHQSILIFPSTYFASQLGYIFDIFSLFSPSYPNSSRKLLLLRYSWYIFLNNFLIEGSWSFTVVFLLIIDFSYILRLKLLFLWSERKNQLTVVLNRFLVQSHIYISILKILVQFRFWKR